MSVTVSPEEALSDTLANPPPLAPPEEAGRVVAYSYHGAHLPMRPAARRRQWMDETPSRFAYRCLPLLTGNQQGWEILAPVGFTVMWDGGPSPASVRVTYDAPVSGEGFAVSHFGHGLLTIMPGCLFRTPEGVNLLLRGPTNMPKAGATALDGVVEADWCLFNATINWKLTIPGCVVRFDKDEPVGLVVPVPRGYVEGFAIEVRDMASNPVLESASDAWCAERNRFQRDKQGGNENKWLSRYLRGVDMSGAPVEDHRKRISIQDVVDRREAPAPAPAPAPATQPPSPVPTPERIRLAPAEREIFDGLQKAHESQQRTLAGFEAETRMANLRMHEMGDQLKALRKKCADFRSQCDAEMWPRWDGLQARVQARLGRPVNVPLGHRLVVEAEGDDLFFTFVRVEGGGVS